MKPDWKDAPEWAKWLALDPSGCWYWYEAEPEWDTRWENIKGSLYEYAGSQVASHDSLESRP